MSNHKEITTMMKVVKLFDELNNSGEVKSVRLIKLNANNKYFIETLKFILTCKKTGISKSGLESYKKAGTQLLDETNEADRWLYVLHWLAENNTGSDKDYRIVNSFLKTYLTNRKFYEQVITKKYELKCDARTVNKAINGLIYEYRTQSCTRENPLKAIEDGDWFCITPKVPGYNAGYVDGYLYAKNGNKITGCQHIIDDITTLGLQDYYINGMLIRKNEEGVSFKENEQYTNTIIRGKIDKSELLFAIFDVIPKSAFYLGASEEKYSARRKRYNRLAEEIKLAGVKNLYVIKDLYCGTDKEEIERWLGIAICKNYPGIIINCDAKWYAKRTKNVIVVEPNKTLYLKCIGVLMHEGENGNEFSGAIVRYKNKTKMAEEEIELNVKYGFTEKELLYYSRLPRRIFNKLLKVDCVFYRNVPQYFVFRGVAENVRAERFV